VGGRCTIIGKRHSWRFEITFDVLKTRVPRAKIGGGYTPEKRDVCKVRRTDRGGWEIVGVTHHWIIGKTDTSVGKIPPMGPNASDSAIPRDFVCEIAAQNCTSI